MLSALSVAACSALPVVQLPGQPTGRAAATAAPAAEATPETGAYPADLPSAGRLAVIGTDGNLYVLEAGREPVPITDDAVMFSGGLTGRVYLQPSWSPDGWLSFVLAEVLDDQTPHVDIRAVRPGEGPSASVLETSRGYIYGYWSPVPCAEGPQCAQFAFLMNDEDRIALHIARVSNGAAPRVTDRIVARAAPFYYSWAPDGGSMLWYRNDATLSIYDVQTGSTRDLPDTPGLFQAPAWSPVDNRLLFARSEAGRSRMTVADSEQRIDLGLPVGGVTFFNWSPDGTQVAFAHGIEPLSPITVIDADGSNERVLAGVEGVVAFFWSPDSTRLAVVSLEQAQPPLPQAARAVPVLHRHQNGSEDIVFVWSVIDVASGEVTRFARFFPTVSQYAVYQYFDQYAQSHRVWSPDSRFIVYAEEASSGPLIRLLDTHQPGQEPLTIMQGREAVFSFDG